MIRRKQSAAKPGGKSTRRTRADLLAELRRLKRQVARCPALSREKGGPRATATLKRSLERYADLYDFAPVAFLTLDSSGCVRELNLAGAHMLGCERDHLIGRPLLSKIARRDGRRFLAHLGRLRRGEERASTELSLAPNGGELVVQMVSVPSPVLRGPRPEYRTVLVDLTERRRAEQAMRESEERLRLAVTATKEAIWDWDVLHDQTTWNVAFLEEFGRPRETGGPEQWWAGRLHPDDHDRVLASFGQAVAACRDTWTCEYRFLRGDGTWADISDRVMIAKDDSGHVVRVVGSMMDMTERNRSAEALRRSENLLRLVTDATPALISYVDSDYRYRMVNRGYQQWFGMTPAETVGRHVSEVIGPAAWERVKDNLMRALAGEEVEYEAELPYRPEHDRWVHVSCRPDRDSEGKVRGFVALVHDITGRRRAEETIRESEERYRSLFNSMAEGFALNEIICDSSGRPVNYRFLDANPAFEQLTGLKPAEVIGKTVLEVLPSTDPEWIETFGRVAVTGEPTHFERYSKEFGRHYELFVYSPTRGQFACVFRDITERKEAQSRVEAARAETETEKSRLEAVMDVLPVGVAIVDERGGRVRSNHVFEEVWGGSPPPAHSIEDYPAYKAWWADTGKPVEPGEWASALAVRDGKTVVGQILEIERFDGKRAFVANSAAPIVDADGRIAGSAVAIFDITERKLVEEALRRSNTRLEILSETAAQLLEAEDPQQIVNSLCEQVMGFLDCQVFFNYLVVEEEGRLHLNAYAGIPEETARQIEWLGFGTAVCGCAARDACRIVAEDIPKTPDPRTEMVRSFGIDAYACHPLMSQNKVIGTLSFGTRTRPRFTAEELEVMKVVADQVSIALERKWAMTALKQTAAELARSNEDLDQFASVASHDLQEPLRTVGGFVQLLEKEYRGKLDAQGDEYISFVVEGVGRMQALIKDLLAYARVSARGAEPGLVKVGDALRHALDSTAVAIGESDAIITQDEMPVVCADVGQLSQLFQNLIGNAIKFHRPGQRPDIHVGAARRPDGWLFSVRDNGIGIAEKDFDRVFQIFQRLHTREKYSGTGMGLAICKRIVDRHGGRIWVESQPGKGSTFFFTIPERLPTDSR